MIDPRTVRAALRDVVDPEIGLDIVTLGLVREVSVDGDRVHVTMILTTPGCPLAGVMQRGAAAAAGRIPGVRDVEVVVAREPVWTPAMIDPAGGEAMRDAD